MPERESADRLSWGIIGTGRIAAVFAGGLASSRTGRLVAVASRTQAAADAFGDRLGVPVRHGSYEALLADERVQAVYVATPHPFHAELAIGAAEAGKHVLCEKPLALNHAQAMAIVQAAAEHDVFLMEAFMYRCHPQTARLVELIRSGEIGEVLSIRVTFSFEVAFDPASRLLNPELGGGGILDVGCYCTSMARLVAGAARSEPFAEPLELKAVGRIGETGVDEYTAATLRFPGDVVAELFCGVRLRAGSEVRILGSEGRIEVPAPWLPGAESTILVTRHGEDEPRRVVVESSEGLYAAEADTVGACLEARQAPAMSWDDSLGNMRALDRWRQEIGLVYEVETPQGRGQDLPVHGRPLARRDAGLMRYGRIDGLEKPVSRLVMGVDNQRTWPHLAVMLDDFFERGGNCFDTAYTYGQGRLEQLLGAWIGARGIRDQVVILDKGAHTPHCDPESLSRQLEISLDRLRTDHVDIYMLHRDNPEIPVGEFVDVLNEHQRAGRVTVFGASNWSLERVREANEWAAARGLRGLAAISNNFSLARMVEPVWAGCVSSSDPVWRAWLTERQMPLMPWSSQARGFFVPGRADPADRSDAELVRCWYADDNFRRLRRVERLAGERGVLPIQVALAYVLDQPFPTFPLIGPRLLSEARTSYLGLAVELSPADLRWLNLEDEAEP
jgi:predicted dehydrogenase/aryl-alcohol dehydrogenase-like predicted oxidoreductase